MLMFITAWCLPVKGQMAENNGYQFYSDWTGHHYVGAHADYDFMSNASISFPGERSDVYVLIKLTDPAQKDQYQITVNGKGFDADGKLWVVPNDFNTEWPTFSYNINYVGDQPAGRKYELKTYLYSQEDETSEALAVFDGCIELIIPVQFSFSPNRIVGEKDQSIPFSLTVTGNSSLAGLQNPSLVINKPGSVNLTSMDGSVMREEQGEYYLDFLSLSGAQTYSFNLNATSEVSGDLSVRVITKEGVSIPYTSSLKISIPFNVSNDDVEGLKAIAAANNNNQALNDYVDSKGWLTDNDDWSNPVSTDWDESISPARLSSLSLRNLKETLDTLNVVPFDSLMNLNIQDCDVRYLDLSMLKKLQSVSVYRTKIQSPESIKLPSGNPDLHVSGETYITIGTPVEGWDNLCEIPAGSEVDLSAYDGQATTFTWYKYGNYGGRETVEWTPVRPGVYTLPAQPEDGVTYFCEIKVSSYPDWTYRTSDIRLTRGAINYSQADIQLLKDLAAANPDCKELQRFVTDSVHGWTEAWPDSYWQDENRKVAVDWNYANPARISKLRVRNMNTVTSLDVSGFTELTYLDCEEVSELKSLDLTKNVKLRELNARYNRMNLKALNVSGLSELTILNIDGAHQLTDLNLSGCTKLTSLNISSCEQLKVDLTGLPLESLWMNNTAYFAEYIQNLPSSIREIYYCGTTYPALDLSKYPYVTGYGVPLSIEELDVTGTAITRLEFGGSKVRYSTLKAGQNVNCSSYSEISIPGLKNLVEMDERSPYTIVVGDTIDLSAEAMVGNIASRYVWVDTHDRIESTGVFIPVEGQAGKFVYGGGGRPDVSYFCIISNERYCRESEINYFSGWRLETHQIQIPEIKAIYDPTEVAALKAIVDGCNSPSLKAWWDREAWKSGASDDWRFFCWWNLDENTNTYHLSSLQISSLGDTLTTLDVSKFAQLDYLYCENNGIKELSLKSNSKLGGISISSCHKLESLILPDEKANLRSLYCLGNSQLTSLEIGDYTNLTELNLRGSEALSGVDLSRLAKLEYLWCNYTQLEPIDVSKYPKLRALGVSRKTKKLDLAQASDSLTEIDPAGSMLQFSTLKLKEGISYKVSAAQTYLSIEDFREKTGYEEWNPIYLFPIGKEIDLSAEMTVGGKTTKVVGRARDRETYNWKTLNLSDSAGKYTITSGQANDNVEIILTNETFPDWNMVLTGDIYSRDGDANLDNNVDVRDVAVTANYIVQSEDRLPMARFGFYEADVNYDKDVNVTDMQGIVNLILGKEVIKSSNLRAAYIPTVELSVENGILYMESEVAVAAVQLELTGMMQAEALLGKAAAFTQVSNVGDTTRILGYSLKEVTVPAGKSALMKFPVGARLAKAVFSDEKAQSLDVRTKGDIATSNETISVVSSNEIVNYPNPFRGTTTLAYSLDETVDRAYIQVYAFNGMLVDIIDGLNTQAGENRFTYSTRLSAGTYIYRLVTQKQGVTVYSKSNTFIIK